MPDFTCSLDAIATDTLCADRGGLLTFFWIDESEIDWTNMALIANWDDANYEVDNFVYNGAVKFNELTFERRFGRLDALFTEDTDYYEVSLLNLLFLGKSSARTISLGNALSCCGILGVVFDNNSRARMFGKEFTDGAWINPLKRGKLSRHLDTTGSFGAADDKNRDEFDLTAQHSFPLPYVNITLSDFRTNHVV